MKKTLRHIFKITVKTVRDADSFQLEKRKYFLIFGHLIGSRPALDQ